MLKVKNKKKGFTLIEVLISLAILAIVIVPMLSMSLGSVKTNKAGEDKEKALYIAQEYVEKFKNEDSFSVGADSDFRDVPDNPDFQYKQTITELDYKFRDKNQNSNTNPAFNSNKYDGKIVIDADDNNILVDIQDKDVSVSGGNKLIGKNSSDEQRTIRVENNSDKITVNLNGVSYPIDKQIVDNSGKKLGYLIVQFKGTGNSDPQSSLPKIQLNVSNFTDDKFTIYPSSEVGVKVDYDFQNEQGKVQVYSNIMIHENYTNNSRVYKINVKVWGKGEDPQKDKPLQEVNAYKNVAQ